MTRLFVEQPRLHRVCQRNISLYSQQFSNNNECFVQNNQHSEAKNSKARELCESIFLQKITNRALCSRKDPSSRKSHKCIFLQKTTKKCLHVEEQTTQKILSFFQKSTKLYFSSETTYKFNSLEKKTLNIPFLQKKTL